MPGESIVSLEFAVGAATCVLAFRLYSLIRATRGVPLAHLEMLEAIDNGNSTQLRQRARGIGYRNPYGESAAELISASEEGATDSKEHQALVARATQLAQRRVKKRAQQGHAADLVALAVVSGIMAFSRETLPTGPLFWSLGGAVLVFLSSSIVARGSLMKSVESSLDALRQALLARPQASTSEGALDCFSCGARTVQSTYEIRNLQTGTTEKALGSACPQCGKMVAFLQEDTAASSWPSVERFDNESSFKGAP